MSIMRFIAPILLLLFPFSANALLIAEVQIEGERADDCYIKIYNTSEEEKNIEGYRLRKRTSTGSESSVRVMPSGTTIKANGYLFWASSRNSDFPEKVNADLQSTQYLARNNSIALFDNEGSLIDALGWGEGEEQYKKGGIFPQNPEKGQTLQRKKANGEYKNTRDNASDFQVYPPPVSPLTIKETHTESAEKEKTNPLLIALLSSIALGLLVLILKKRLN